MKEMLKNTAILLCITLVAGLLLGCVYENTKDIIAKQEADAKVAAYKEVFSNAADFEVYTDAPDASSKFATEGFEGDSIDEVMKALDNSKNVIGYAFTITTHEGYGGDITFTMGITLDGTVNGISILSINETAGLGMEAEKVLKPQYANKKVESFVYTKTGAIAENEVDAISGATITTNAVTTGVNCGLYYFNNFLGGAVNE